MPVTSQQKMLSTPKATNAKQQKGRKVSTKAVLVPPFEESWPNVEARELELLTAEIDRCAVHVLKPATMQPKWKELKIIDKSKRKEVIAEFQLNYLASLSPTEKNNLLIAEDARKEKLSHIFLGYNKIMRELEKGNVAALLVNETAKCEFLPKFFLPVCRMKKIPLIAVSSLDKFYPRTIAVGFKKSIISSECCFHSLYMCMVNALKDSSESCLNISTSKSDVISTPVSKVALPVMKKKSGPPAVNVNEYHLKRTRPDQPVFIPGVGFNPKAVKSDTEFIMLCKDDPLLDCPVERFTDFGNRQPRPVSGPPHKRARSRSPADIGSVVPHVNVKQNVRKQASDALFLLDVEGASIDHSGNRTEAGSRATDSLYLPAQVQWNKPNPNKRKK